VLQVGEGFRDDLGYYRRTGTRKYLFDIGLRPRPEWLRAHGVREDHPHLVWDFYQDLSGRSIAYKMHTGNTFFMSNGAYLELSVNPNRQVIEAPFAISSQVDSVPPGRYDWTEYMVYGSTDPSRAVSVTGRLIVGGLWSGRQRTINSTLTIRPSYRFRMTAGLSRTSADLDEPANSHFTATLYTVRANYSFSTGMFLDALTQYDAERHVLNANLRFNLIHHPLSDLFIVFNEQRSHPLGEPAELPGRSFIVKFTQLLAF
jgi:hypothetical protein